MNVDHRAFKDGLYGEFGRIAAALASPKRLEMLDLLAQRARSVEDLALEMDLSVANASRHLRILALAKMVEVRRSGTFAFYRIASRSVLGLLRSLESAAAERLVEVGALLNEQLGAREIEDVAPSELGRLVRGGKVVLLDVRPEAEYQAGHIPGARTVPIETLGRKKTLDALPRDREIIVYCRGQYCVWADEAVDLLSRRGFSARRLLIGAPDWAALGGELEAAG